MAELSMPLDYGQVVKQTWDKEAKRSLGSKLFNLDGAHIVSYPQKIVYRPGKMAQLLETMNRELGAKMVNARLEVDLDKGLMIIPGSPGLVVNIDAIMADLPREWEDFDSFRISIIMVEQNPEITEADLKGMGELSTFNTWFRTSDANRASNLRKAAQALNGTMVKPGEEVSYNKLLGPRTAATGYMDAMVIVGGKFMPGVGGGICQVSTTLYNACLLAGLKIVERHQHNMVVSYVPLGRDATVSYGQQDFRFANNTDDPIYIRAVTSGGNLTVSIYGNLAHKQKIVLSSVVDGVSPFKEVHVFDASLPPGAVKVEHAGINGYSVRAFRSFYDDTGKLIKQEQLSSDHYRTLDKIIHTGPTSNLPPGESGAATPPEPGVKPAPSPSGQTDDGYSGTLPPSPEPIDDATQPVHPNEINGVE